MAKETRQMPPVNPDDKAALDEISKALAEHESAVRKLCEQAKEIAAKYRLDFKECREIGCVHTYRKQYSCARSDSCLRSIFCDTPVKDWYQAPAPSIKPDYPHLGWKTATRGDKKKDSDELDIRRVIKETPCYLFVEGCCEPLHKRYLTTIEDCKFLSGYFCADDLDAIQFQKALLDVEREEEIERNRKFMEKYNAGRQQVDPNSIFNPIKKEPGTNG